MAIQNSILKSPSHHNRSEFQFKTLKNISTLRVVFETLMKSKG